MNANKKPLLIVMSAPSGAGKSTLCVRLLEQEPDIAYSVSCTTRAPRGGEVDGRSYHFLSTDVFEKRVQAGEFLEHALVHGNRYGTLKETVRAAMQQGRSILMDIDVQGARQVREALAGLPPNDLMARGFVDIFVHAPSMQVLRARLVGRAEDAAEVIERRMQNAVREMADAGRYRHQVVNDDLERALAELRGIIEKERNR
jgi:guanylate kinase